MVRGVIILVILTVFRQAITGSVFDKFSTPEKKDKNKMLMYLRGLLKFDATTVKVTTQPTGQSLAPSPLAIEQLWDGKSLPDRSDKSKMLAYLRGIKSPNSPFRLYEEPQHRGVIQTLETQTTGKPDASNQNLDIDSNINDMWNPATATQITILQPVEKNSHSDTCFWRGQQSQPDMDPSPRSKLVQDKGKGDGKGKEKGEGDQGIENMGESIIHFWECIQTKFWKSYDKIQRKICNVFAG